MKERIIFITNRGKSLTFSSLFNEALMLLEGELIDIKFTTIYDMDVGIDIHSVVIIYKPY